MSRFNFPLDVIAGSATLAIVGLTVIVDAQNLALTLMIRNDARVPRAVLAEAQATVAKVYAQAGVDVVWLLSGARFTIVILARESEMAVKMREVPNAMGYAPGSETVPGRQVYVLHHQIHELARGFGAEKTAVLGTVIAHEVGHLLFLPGSHSAVGLMRSKWNQSDFQSAHGGTLLFTAEQGKLIRDRMRRREE